MAENEWKVFLKGYVGEQATYLAGKPRTAHIFPQSIEELKDVFDWKELPKITIKEKYPMPFSFIVDLVEKIHDFTKSLNPDKSSTEAAGSQIFEKIFNKIKDYDGTDQIKQFIHDCSNDKGVGENDPITYEIPCDAKNTSYGTQGNDGWSSLSMGVVGTVLHGISEFMGGLGSNFGMKLFPYPTWKLPEQGYRWSLNLSVTLFNTSKTQAEENTNLTDSMVAHGRWIQKSVFCLPGAIYTIRLPSGQKNSLCSADITVSGDGAIRKIPGQTKIPMVPDVYKFNAVFKSIIDDNYNTLMMDEAWFDKGADKGKDWETVAKKFESTTQQNPQPVQSPGSRFSDIAREFDDRIETIDAMALASAKIMAAKGGADADPVPASDSGLYDKFDRLHRETAERIGVENQARLESRLDAVEEEIASVRSGMDDIRDRIKPGIPMDDARSLNARLREYESRAENLEQEKLSIGEQLVDEEMSFLVQMNEAINKRAEAEEPIECPKSYFALPRLSDDERSRIRYMTRDERAAYIEEQKQELKSRDRWGIAECPDLLLRLCVASFIIDVMAEIGIIADELEYENPQFTDHYRYKYDMLDEDLKTTLDPGVPFELNKTNVVYVPDSYIPEELRPSSQSVQAEEPLSDSSSGAVALAKVVGERALTQAQKEERLVQLRNEIVRREFGDETAFTKAAFGYITQASEEAGIIKRALVELKTHTEGNAIVVDPETGKFSLSREIVTDYDGTEPNSEIPVYDSREDAIADLTRLMFYHINETKKATVGNLIDGNEEEAQKLLSEIRRHLIA